MKYIEVKSTNTLEFTVKNPLILLMSFLFLSCAHSPKETAKHESGLSIGDQLKASRYSNIYFSGQPSEADWGKLKEQGFTHVVNLRKKKEYNEASERKQVEKRGMIYSQQGVVGSRDLTNNEVDSITQAIVKHRSKGKTLVHCSSGNRAAYWAGLHFKKDHGFSNEKSIKLAQEMGLTNEKLLERLKKQLKD